ncbi:hypothetical protein [Aliarcobacter thereius]|uniref:Uncharacterized protein n=2 Tax=Aliarcobacter thereius TaxID=544718 RepID=A0A1C0B5P9_9BACT|nr:hypothetical protein [Aliarcobacter thereius]OCL90493.1 hypothetical protein AAX25_01587 [Aliarcobacter thereius]OCL95712.1 hypothetical protein AA347_01191 [Aliarcobacter thereius LMG 24486]OCL98356.1 hypothetical protein AAX29_01592 [Aliarcobacter thereius]QBF16304.1 hypothetical protein ATH_1256 [Aliarcobacter thereius LMG 24486]TLS71036.1 hypothetical protein FE246_08720 [Aliarcobacter thereius]
MAKRKIEASNIDDIIIETKVLNNAKVGRPKKDNKKSIQVNLYFTEGQLEAVEGKMKEIGFSVRQDYFRKLLRADIENFDEL